MVGSPMIVPILSNGAPRARIWADSSNLGGVTSHFLYRVKVKSCSGVIFSSETLIFLAKRFNSPYYLLLMQWYDHLHESVRG
jgi:hypothetical protein